MTATGEPPPSASSPRCGLPEADAQKRAPTLSLRCRVGRKSVERREHLRAFFGTPRAAYPCGFGSDAYGLRWARLDSNQGPTDYESAALTS